MKTARNIEEFITEVNNSKQLIIYGAGKVGISVCEFLNSRGILVESFAETIQSPKQELKGIPVCSLEDILWNYQMTNITVILAVTKVHRISMEKELKKRKINSYIMLSETLLYELEREVQKEKARQAESEKKILKESTIGYLTPGYLNTDYAEQRLIINKIEGVSYVAMPKEIAEIECSESEYEKEPEFYKQMMEACYCPKEYKPEVDLIHTFNMVCDTDKPWCASFETSMPRMEFRTEVGKEYYLQLAEYMKKPNCKMLYAFCRNAYEIQKHNLMQHLPLKDVALLMEKTKVLHPPQKVLIAEEEFIRKHQNEGIHFIFIGRAFFFKGGREVIRALSQFEDQYEFKLTLISGLLCNDYFTKTTYEEAIKWKELIQEKKWIDYYESVSNNEVLEKCKEATVGLLPSFADTYGYAVLEMQAAGCPVVTTNIRAFPELNHEECGWICQIPINDFGFCVEQDKSILSEILEKELVKCFQDIFEHPNLIKIKGQSALKRIREMHDPDRYQEELKRNLE